MPGFIIYKDINNECKKLSHNQQLILNYYKNLFQINNLNIDIFSEEQLKYINDLYKLYDLNDLYVLTLTQSNIKIIPNYFMNIKNLFLCDCYELIDLPNNLSNIQKIEIYNCKKLEFLPYYSSLQELIIENCDNLIIPRNYHYNLNIKLSLN